MASISVSYSIDPAFRPLKKSPLILAPFNIFSLKENFVDMALLKRLQFDGERIKYFRKKTEYEGDFFSVKQNQECLKILNTYVDNKDPEDYIFPILSNDIPNSRIHRVKNDKIGWFNTHLRKLAKRAEIEKDVTSYSARDTWTNIGLDIGIDIRKISAGLGHSSIEVTNKHYGASIQEKILDEINSTWLTTVQFTICDGLKMLL